jgi:hypothetical protein
MDAEFAEDKNLWRARLIGDCHVCYVVSIGGPAAAKVIRADIYPIKVPDGGPALDILQTFPGGDGRVAATLVAEERWASRPRSG